MKTTELKTGTRLRVIRPFKIERPGETAYAASGAEAVVHKTAYLPVFTIKFYSPERLKGTVHQLNNFENLDEHFEIITGKVNAQKTRAISE
jgi:hypothetical protein